MIFVKTHVKKVRDALTAGPGQTKLWEKFKEDFVRVGAQELAAAANGLPFQEVKDIVDKALENSESEMAPFVTFFTCFSFR